MQAMHQIFTAVTRTFQDTFYQCLDSLPNVTVMWFRIVEDLPSEFNVEEPNSGMYAAR